MLFLHQNLHSPKDWKVLISLICLDIQNPTSSWLRAWFLPSRPQSNNLYLCRGMKLGSHSLSSLNCDDPNIPKWAIGFDSSRATILFFVSTCITSCTCIKMSMDRTLLAEVLKSIKFVTCGGIIIVQKSLRTAIIFWSFSDIPTHSSP